MNMEGVAARSLPELELEVEAEGPGWTLHRLQQRLQAEAARIGEDFPRTGRRLVLRRTRRMRLRMAAGMAEL